MKTSRTRWKISCFALTATLDVSIIFLLGTVMVGEVVFVIHVVVLVQPQLSKWLNNRISEYEKKYWINIKYLLCLYLYHYWWFLYCLKMCRRLNCKQRWKGLLSEHTICQSKTLFFPKSPEHSFSFSSQFCNAKIYPVFQLSEKINLNWKNETIFKIDSSFICESIRFEGMVSFEVILYYPQWDITTNIEKVIFSTELFLDASQTN